MKLITAVIRPDRLREVKEALFRVGVTGMTLSHMSGHGRHRWRSRHDADYFGWRHRLGARQYRARDADGTRARAVLWWARPSKERAQHLYDEPGRARHRERAVGRGGIFARLWAWH